MNPQLGLVYALLAAASYGLMSYLVHWNPKHFSVEQMTLIRGLITMLGVLPFCFRDLGKYFERKNLLLWLRAIAGATGLFLYYYTLQGTVAGNANFLMSSSPLFVSVIAWFFFNEKLSPREIAGIFVILIANLLLYIPNRSTMPLWVWEAGIAGALVSSIAYLSLGTATKRFSTSLIVFGFGAMSVIFSLVMPGAPWLRPDSADWGFLILAGFLGLAAQFLTTLSFVHLKSSIATSVGRSCVLFAGILDITLSGYRPHILEWLSYLTVIAGVALSQQKREKPAPKIPPV